MNIYNSKCFKVENYKYLKQEKPDEIIVEALSVLIGDYGIYQKQAALLLLRALLTKEFLRDILNNSCEIYPFDRGDYRVRQWIKDVKARGYCEKCGSTENLEAHHIIKWADYPAGRIDLKNGMCLCHKCHTEEHKYDQSYWMMKAKDV